MEKNINNIRSLQNSDNQIGFGYQLIGYPKRMAIYEREARIVARAYELYSACDCHLKAVSKALEAEFKVHVSVLTIHAILRDHRYVGLCSTGGRFYLIDELAIVSLEVYWRVQFALNSRRDLKP